jgi:hypothetical protein
MPPGMGPVNGGPGGMGPPDGGPNPMGPSPPDVKGGCCNVCSVAQGPNAPMNMSGTCKTCVKNDDLCSTKDDCCACALPGASSAAEHSSRQQELHGRQVQQKVIVSTWFAYRYWASEHRKEP